MIEYRVKLHPIYRCEKCKSVLKKGFHRDLKLVYWTCEKCGHEQLEKEAPDRYLTIGDLKHELRKDI